MTGPALRRIVVLRHGETVANRDRVWQGHLDSELSERGLAQARAAAGALLAYDPAMLVSSDLGRAMTTARELGRLADLPVRADPRLREVNVGQWQGMATDLVRERYPRLLDDLDAGLDVRRGVTGETVAEVARRIGAAVADTVAALPAGGTAVMVTHGVSARIALAVLVGLDPLAASQVFRVLGNCHWAVAAESGSTYSGSTAVRWRIESYNAGPDLSTAAFAG